MVLTRHQDPKGSLDILAGASFCFDHLACRQFASNFTPFKDFFSLLGK
jgi:hypothetical protein